VLSFNYGAKKYGRIRQGIRFSTLAALAAAAIPWVFIMIFPGLFIRIFNNDPELIKYGVPAFRIYFSAFFLMSLQISGQTVSMALGRAKTAIFFSLLRKAVIVAPLTVILPGLWNLGVNGVFLAEPISNVIGGLACYITMMLVVYIPLGRLSRAEQAGTARDEALKG
jgi:Na+-driven multidrug efflux pump